MSASVWMIGALPYVVSRTIDVPEYDVVQNDRTLIVQRLPSEAIGNFTLTLTNVVVGSTILIEDISANVAYSGTASSSTVSLSLPVYAYGSTKNSLVVKVRKGSATPYYRPYETQVTAALGTQSVYVSQIPDE